jgi:hypothetical protein
MNSQDLHNLQEAYLEVYDEAYKKFPYKKVEDKIHKKEANNPTGRGTPQSVNMGKVIRHFRGEVRRTERREHSPKISKAKEAENRERGTQKEQVDLYDIILSHLLDEGYADTQEQAEVIMVNMSEDWKESIVLEEVLDEKIATPPSWWNARRRLDPEKRRLRRSRDFNTYGGENQDPDERTISTSKGEGGITKNPKKLRKQKAMGEHG